MDLSDYVGLQILVKMIMMYDDYDEVMMMMMVMMTTMMMMMMMMRKRQIYLQSLPAFPLMTADHINNTQYTHDDDGDDNDDNEDNDDGDNDWKDDYYCQERRSGW